MKVWLVYGMTESGDEWQLVFAGPPLEDDILKAIDSDPWLSEEYKADCIQGWDILGLEVIGDA